MGTTQSTHGVMMPPGPQDDFMKKVYPDWRNPRDLSKPDWITALPYKRPPPKGCIKGCIKPLPYKPPAPHEKRTEIKTLPYKPPAPHEKRSGIKTLPFNPRKL